MVADLPRQSIGLLAPDSDAEVRALHERFTSDPANTDLSALRPVVARSWARSLACKVDPSLRVFAKTRVPRLDEQFLRDATPVLEELERLVSDTAASVCIADHNGTIGMFVGDADVRRRAEASLAATGGAMSEDLVGTNGEGTVIEEGRPVQIWGAEHFCEGMQEFYCTSVPILDPVRRSLRAILSISLPDALAKTVDPRSVAMVARGSAAELGQVMASRLAVREQALLTSYLAEVRKRGVDSVVVMDDRTTIASKGALQMLGDGDYGVLAGYAREAETTARPVERDVVVGPRSVLHVFARPIESGNETVGSILLLRLAKAPDGTPGARAARRVDPFTGIIGESVGLRRALQVASTAVRRRLPSYIIGEPGTGKSELAQAMIRELGTDALTWDCAAGSFDAAAAEEVGVALDVGAAVVVTNVDQLADPVREGLAEVLGMREHPLAILTMSAMSEEHTPLVAALGAVEIELPPLRKRREDIPPLVAHFLASAAHGVLRVTPALQRSVTKADWRDGNVAQLRHFVNTAAARCDAVELGPQHLSDSQRRVLAPQVLSRLEEAELRQIRDALAEVDGNRVRAAELLEIGRSTLYRKIELYERRGFDVER